MRRTLARSIASAAIFSLLCACSKPAPVTTETVDAGAAPEAAMRIVAVGGPTTEAVWAVGKGDAVVGVDTSSLFPEAATKLPKVGYQRALAAEGVLALNPTLVVASGEAGPPAALEQLKGAGVRVELVNVEANVQGAKDRITKVAELVHGDPAPALAKLDADLAKADAFVKTTTKKPKALVLYARGENALFVFGT
ncbi:MAG TPA: ABC transporter substrate-binding protein, partial [Polyangiaceae bacterium]